MRWFAILLVVSAAARAEDGTKIGDPISWGKVTVFPIVRTAARPAQDVVTLRGGLEAKLVTVTERGDVNSVVVKNHARKPLLLVGGEMILGGQQDRIIGQDQLVPPQSSAVVKVFCVEHGRWAGGQHFGSAGGIADAKVRARAKLRGNQQEVWDEVAKKAGAMGASTPSGTYRAVNAKAEKDLEPYRKAIRPKLDPQKEIVGLAAAVDGRVVSVDVFATPELFAQYEDRILNSAFIEAEGGDSRAKPAPPPDAKAVESFLEKARKEKSISVVRGANGAALMESSVSAE